MPDVEIPCVQCREIFIFTEKEQEMFYQRNMMTPQRCPRCRSKKAALREDAPKRFEIVCDNCGKHDTVPFQPKVGRSVLCKDCQRQSIIERLEDEVLSIDPTVLRVEIGRLSQLIEHAKQVEERDIQSKLLKLKAILKEEGVFDNPKIKLLIFTEHKATLDYLTGDGRDERPLGKLREWGLTLAQIHGGMKIGDRDTPGSRIYAEREFRESAQVLVATEAAGEGINLQFCWLMVNFDIPWNPVRLEQRVGRIHRYGQEKNCLVFNFVAQNTREGRVLQTLIERLKEIREDLGSDQVFDVVGEVFPSNLLEKLFREMYARQMDEHQINKSG